eukprot:1159783-Pelagomonas_calceolata.AAC.13
MHCRRAEPLRVVSTSVTLCKEGHSPANLSSFSYQQQRPRMCAAVLGGMREEGRGGGTHALGGMWSRGRAALFPYLLYTHCSHRMDQYKLVQCGTGEMKEGNTFDIKLMDPVVLPECTPDTI